MSMMIVSENLENVSIEHCMQGKHSSYEHLDL